MRCWCSKFLTARYCLVPIRNLKLILTTTAQRTRARASGVGVTRVEGLGRAWGLKLGCRFGRRPRAAAHVRGSAHLSRRMIFFAFLMNRAALMG